jgi:hypothetical protein
LQQQRRRRRWRHRNGSSGTSRSSVPGCGVRGDLGNSVELSGMAGLPVVGTARPNGLGNQAASRGGQVSEIAGQRVSGRRARFDPTLARKTKTQRERGTCHFLQAIHFKNLRLDKSGFPPLMPKQLPAPAALCDGYLCAMAHNTSMLGCRVFVGWRSVSKRHIIVSVIGRCRRPRSEIQWTPC